MPFYFIEPAESGVTNTGDATVEDVALGKTFSSAELTDAVGTLVVPDAATGDATAEDVADGKTFSNVDDVGLTGTSTKNATVAEDAPIQPPQACVDGMSQFLLGLSNDNTNFKFGDVGIEAIDPDWMTGLALGLSATVNHYEFGGNKLPAAQVDAILAAFVVSGLENRILDLDGGTSAAPTPVQAHIDGAWTITITDVPVGTITLEDNNGTSTGPVFGVDVDVTSGNASTIAENLANFINGDIPLWHAEAVDGVVSVVVTDDNALPLTAATDAATNLTIENTAAGQSFIQNADKQALDDTGWTVTTN